MHPVSGLLLSSTTNCEMTLYKATLGWGDNVFRSVGLAWHILFLNAEST